MAIHQDTRLHTCRLETCSTTAHGIHVQDLHVGTCNIQDSYRVKPMHMLTNICTVLSTMISSIHSTILMHHTVHHVCASCSCLMPLHDAPNIVHVLWSQGFIRNKEMFFNRCIIYSIKGIQ